MIQVMQLPRSVVLTYIYQIVCKVKWACDCLLTQSFFQPRGIFELPDYVDDLSVTCFENNNHERGDSSMKCAVCLCRINEGDEVIELRCSHLYHRVCIERRLGYGHRTCPLCWNNKQSPQLAAELHLQAEVILINFCSSRSRDDLCTWWLR